MAMLVHRSTPLENGLSPAELLMGRKTKNYSAYDISTVESRGTK